MAQMDSLLGSPHAKTIESICNELGVNHATGLSNSEAKKRLLSFGKNIPSRQHPRSLWRLLIDQFLDPIIYVLLIATALAFLFGENIEAIAILVVIAITVAIGFVMEWQSITSIEKLRKQSITRSGVLREGVVINLDSRNIVPGDIVLLHEGDVVPADGRIFQMEGLGVKEDALTGESGQVDKQLLLLQPDTEIMERTNMVFAGTIVSRGSAGIIVTHTGSDTVAGKIHTLAATTAMSTTPLDRKLLGLSRGLILLTFILVILVALMGLYQGRDLWLTIETAIALAVAAIPEGLPIVASIALARGMLRLSRKRVIIKNMTAVQTLGEMGVIFTDKTGTLTENKMTVQKIITPANEIIDFNKEISTQVSDKSGLDLLLSCAVLCNNAGQRAEAGIGEDPLETALLEWATGLEYKYRLIRQEYPKILEIPFDVSSRKMVTLHEHSEGYYVFVKGAAETVLTHCTFADATSTDRIQGEALQLQQADDLASQGLRVLAFAYRFYQQRPDPENLLNGLTYLGLIGFLDPPRADVRQAMDIYKQAGIRVVMVTGDHPATAEKIARECGLLSSDQVEHVLMKGDDLPKPSALTNEDVNEILATSIFARVLPDQKLALINIYQQNKMVVGMTGDGINDAPALKKADIGIAMGIRGTEAAREVADVILKDDQFTSIKLAIHQGRTIFENIRKFVVYLMSSNLAEIISVAVASIAHLPIPLLPLQILFLNLVTDIFPALAIGMGDGSEDLMRQPPRPANEPILTREKWRSILIYGLSISVAVVGITFYASEFLRLAPEKINNLAFYTLVLAQLINVFNLPGNEESIFNNEITRNRWVWGAILISLVLVALPNFFSTTKMVLSLVPLQVQDYTLIVIFSISSFLIAQFVKSMVSLGFFDFHTLLKPKSII
ncbi:MAG: cation-transporting P-type ATPase [Saprospiraceae bacterium]|nr:cation-transporting P-type ATPase [Saprospiraceae bacterium]